MARPHRRLPVDCPAPPPDPAPTPTPLRRCTADWGASPFQSLGGCVAAAAKAAKATSAAVALVDSPLSGGWVGRAGVYAC